MGKRTWPPALSEETHRQLALIGEYELVRPGGIVFQTQKEFKIASLTPMLSIGFFPDNFIDEFVSKGIDSWNRLVEQRNEVNDAIISTLNGCKRLSPYPDRIWGVSLPFDIWIDENFESSALSIWIPSGQASASAYLRIEINDGSLFGYEVDLSKFIN